MTTPALDIFLFAAGLPFNGDTIKSKSLGGSESAAAYLSRELAARGHRVRVFSNGEPGKFDGVEYRPAAQFEGFAMMSPSDVVIVQRLPELMTRPFLTKCSILWCHDLALRRLAPVVKATSWTIDRIAVLSKYMRDQYAATYGLEEQDLLWQTRNGVDIGAAPLGGQSFAERDRDLLLYGARPERGLDVLLRDVFPRILALRSTAKLAVCTYDNPAAANMPWLHEINRLAAAFPGRVKQLGALSKPELFKVMAAAGAYVYPTPSPISPEFREVSCISALECAANGLPFVSFREGALPETAKESLLAEPGNFDQMAELVARVTSSETNFNTIRDAQLKHLKAGRYSWAEIAEEWEAEIFRTIAAKNDDPVRLASWFYRRSEIEGAERILNNPDVDGPVADRLRTEIAERYKFRESEDALREHYEAMGEETDADLWPKFKAGLFTRDYITNNPEARFAFMRDVLSAGQVKNVFDIGCGHGWSSLHLANHLKGVDVYGYDVDHHATAWCERLRDAGGADDRERCSFTSNHIVAFKTWPALRGGGFDSCVVSEVLEHVRDPYKFLEEAERTVKPGGLVVITVPFGPWEFQGPNWHGRRAHVREISVADLHDMLGHKPGLRLGAVTQTPHNVLGEQCGFLAVAYNADHTPIGRVDWDRKLKIQAPRETLSVTMIVGPRSEESIAWCLNSISPLADELIVVDTGTTDGVREICRRHGARMLTSESPLKIGFDNARNVGVDAATCDWVLWIDCDERMTDGHELGKYLRRNHLHGYTLRQVHLSVDGSLPLDTPVRIFRNRRGLRFFGHIHEHPETALNKGPGLVAMIANPQLAHIGYISNQQRAGRYFRNRPMMEEDHRRFPDRILGFHLEARDQWLLLSELLQRNGNVPSPEMFPVAEEILRQIKLYEDAQGNNYGINPEEFRTLALRVLGRGFEASVHVKIGRDNVGDPSPLEMRFETPKQFEAHVARLAKEKLEAVTGPFW